MIHGRCEIKGEVGRTAISHSRMNVPEYALVLCKREKGAIVPAPIIPGGRGPKVRWTNAEKTNNKFNGQLAIEYNATNCAQDRGVRTMRRTGDVYGGKNVLLGRNRKKKRLVATSWSIRVERGVAF